MWSSGEVVAVREIWRGRIWKARPWIVVHDTPEQLALWIPNGSPTKIPPGSGIPRDDWLLEGGTFTTDTLRLAVPGAWHSVLLFWSERVFEGWYVNLERPLARTPVGFDYLDRELDIYVRPDRTWEYLDEDEFDEARRLGVIDEADAARVREEAERVLTAVARWDPPYCDGWESWRPPPEWTIPQLPAGWDIV